MTEPVPARVRERGGDEEEQSPWAAVKRLFAAVFRRLDVLEAQRAARHGRDGSDGISVTAARIDPATGHLIFGYSDGTEQDVGRVTAEPAPPPRELRFERGPDGRITRSVLG